MIVRRVFVVWVRWSIFGFVSEVEVGVGREVAACFYGYEGEEEWSEYAVFRNFW